ncbi:DUF4238 domain-containing protein [Nocardia nepalensis]|uniref:DUF4238 domain-containing protein n=1 Tax=Nocardia nepalensis TaxID=3375448 RepID=UPI003B673A50
MSDDEIKRSKEQTRKNSQTTFRHHYVPRMYLKRWATGEGDEIRYTNVDTKQTELVLPEEIAVEPNFYQIAAPDIDADGNPDMWFETHMGRIEDRAANWLRALDQQSDGRIKDSNLISNLAVFIGLQSQRTKRGRQSESNIDEAINRYGAERILNLPGFLPILCEVAGKPYSARDHRAIVADILAQKSVSRDAKPKMIDSAIGVWKNTITPMLENDLMWWLVSADSALITSDEPVLRIPRKRDSRELPVSFRKAKLIAFPIGPDRLIIMSRKGALLKPPHKLNSTEVKFLNREFALNCNELVFEEPSSQIASQLNVPPYPSASENLPNAITTAQQFAKLVSLPTRWSAASHAPQWPLSRWTSD